jgi:hypothetical protein
MDEPKVARDTAISFGLLALVLLVLRWTEIEQKEVVLDDA